jgi:hypothetical protein
LVSNGNRWKITPEKKRLTAGNQRGKTPGLIFLIRFSAEIHGIKSSVSK